MFKHLATNSFWVDKTKLLQMMTHLDGHSLEVYHLTEVGSGVTYCDLEKVLLRHMLLAWTKLV